MLMKEQLVQLVIEGKKRQTRRPIKAGEALVTIDGVKTVLAGNGKRIKYQVGRDYSLQYGRGLPTRYWHEKHGLLTQSDFLANESIHGKNFVGWPLSNAGFRPLKIKLMDVWAEDVRTISYHDSLAEGFSNHDEFLCTWANFYDKKLVATWDAKFRIVHWKENSRELTGAGFGHWLSENRPENLYQAWALRFEVVR